MKKKELRKFLKEHGLVAKKLAERLGMTEQMLRWHMSNHINPTLKLRISAALKAISFEINGYSDFSFVGEAEESSSKK